MPLEIEDLSGEEIEVLSLLAGFGLLNFPELHSKLGVNVFILERILRRLQVEGLISRNNNNEWSLTSIGTNFVLREGLV